MTGQPHSRPCSHRHHLTRTARTVVPLALCVAAVSGLTACDTQEALHKAGEAANRIESTVVKSTDTLKTATRNLHEQLGLGPYKSEKTKPPDRGPTKRKARRPPRPPGKPLEAASPPKSAPTHTSPQEVLEPRPTVSPSDNRSEQPRTDEPPTATPDSSAEPEVYWCADPDVRDAPGCR